MEVLKEHTDDNAKEQEKTGWEDLAELNKDAEQTTWEDVAKMMQDSVENTEEEKPEPIVLSMQEIQQLPTAEQTLYILNPQIYTQLQQIRREQGSSVGLDTLTEKMAQKLEMIDYAQHGMGENYQTTQRKLEQIADIYTVLDGCLSSLDDTLLDIDDTEMDKLKHCFDIAHQAMPMETEIPEPRESIVKRIASKIHSLRRGKAKDPHLDSENQEIRQRNSQRQQFLRAMVGGFRAHNLNDDKAIRGLAEVVEDSIMQNDMQTFRIAVSEIGYYKVDDLERCARLSRELGPARVASQEVLAHYFQLFQMDEASEDKFRQKVWPTLIDDETASPRAEILNMVPASKDKAVVMEKFDFAVDKLLPQFTTENQETWEARAKFYPIMLRYAADRATYERVQADIDEQLVPFLTEVDGTQAAKCYGMELASNLIKWDFEHGESSSSEDLAEKTRQNREKIEKYVKASQELAPFMQEATPYDAEIRLKVMDLALEKEFEPKFIEYLKAELFPKIERNDRELGSWTRGRNFVRGEGRHRNFDFDCLTAKVSPQNINKLLMQRRELPTSDTNRLEQNRVDALAIEHVVIPDHTFIHHEHPLTNDLLAAMVEYYDNRDSERAENARRKLEEIAKECPKGGYGRLDNYIYDYKNYEKRVQGEVKDDNAASRNYDNVAIDILRRLAQNTKPDLMEIPQVEDAEWLELMSEAGIRLNPENGRMQVDWRGTGKLAKYVNDWLLERQGEYGLDPLKLNAIAFTERAATYALRGVSEKERRELPYDENFKEFVKLQELTGSYDKFNPEEFERFWRGFQDVSMDDDQELKEHYWRLIERELKQAGKLQKKYEAKGMKDAGMILQSDNLLHEIVMLMDMREPQTVRERMDEAALGVNHNKDEDLSAESK